MKLHLIPLIVLFNILNIQVITAQDLPDELSPFIGKPSKDKLSERTALLESIETMNLSDIDRWTYNLTKSTVLLYNGKDSSVHYFLKAQQYMPKVTCILMNDIYRMEQNKKYIFKDEKTSFLTDLPNFDHIGYLEECNTNYLTEIEKRTHPVSAIEEIIMDNDQFERKKESVDMTKQRKLDSINMHFLDSIYQVYKSFKPFNKYEQNAFSFVLHHSDNCDWIYKWFVIWLEEKRKGNVIGEKLLRPAFNRMLKINEGYCYKLDSKRCEQFKEMLSADYREYEEYWSK